jgi:hypothetical protein
MNTKLAINIREGTVEVEGDEAFVRSIYQDFKEHIGKLVALQPAAPKLLELPPERAAIANETGQVQKSRAARRAGSAVIKKATAVEYKPAFNKDIDLSGLDSFYDAFGPSNHPEKILMFAIFLREKLKVTPCTADHIFTCYFTLKTKTKTPTAFVQAFRDAQGRFHYIEFVSPQDIQITIAGDNYFNEKLKRMKGSAE